MKDDSLETIVWSPVLETGYYCGSPRFQETDFRGHHFILGSILDIFVMTEVDDVECQRYITPVASGWMQGSEISLTVVAKIDGKMIEVPVHNSIDRVNDWLWDNITENSETKFAHPVTHDI
jgi:hypothetical protein